MQPKVCRFHDNSEASAHDSVIRYIFRRKRLGSPGGDFSGLITADKARTPVFQVARGGPRAGGGGWRSPASNMSPRAD